jgi:hypothetical protein
VHIGRVYGATPESGLRGRLRWSGRAAREAGCSVEQCCKGWGRWRARAPGGFVDYTGLLSNEVAYTTLRYAMRLLRERGYIETIHGQGTFVLGREHWEEPGS